MHLLRFSGRSAPAYTSVDRTLTISWQLQTGSQDVTVPSATTTFVSGHRHGTEPPPPPPTPTGGRSLSLSCHHRFGRQSTPAPTVAPTDAIRAVFHAGQLRQSHRLPGATLCSCRWWIGSRGSSRGCSCSGCGHAFQRWQPELSQSISRDHRERKRSSWT